MPWFPIRENSVRLSITSLLLKFLRGALNSPHLFASLSCSHLLPSHCSKVTIETLRCNCSVTSHSQGSSSLNDKPFLKTVPEYILRDIVGTAVDFYPTQACHAEGVTFKIKSLTGFPDYNNCELFMGPAGLVHCHSGGC